MSHLKGIGFENFRVFDKPVWFDFAPVTILTGPNSSGKSSISKALNLFKHNSKLKTIDFDTPNHQLGTLDLVKNAKGKTDAVTFCFSFELGEQFKNLRIKLEYLDLFYNKNVETRETTLMKFELFNSSNGNVLFSSERFEKDENMDNVKTSINYALFLDLYYSILELDFDYDKIPNDAFRNFVKQTQGNNKYEGNIYNKEKQTSFGFGNFESIERSINFKPSDTYFRWFCLMSEAEIKSHYNRKINRAEKELLKFKENIKSEQFCFKYHEKYLSDMESYGTKNENNLLLEDYEKQIIKNKDEFILDELERYKTDIKKIQFELEKNIKIKKTLFAEMGEQRLRELINEIERNTLKVTDEENTIDYVDWQNPHQLGLWSKNSFIKNSWLNRFMVYRDAETQKSFFTETINGRWYGANCINPAIFDEVGNCIERRSEKFKGSLSNFAKTVIDYLLEDFLTFEKSLNTIEAVRNSSQRLYSYNTKASSFNELLKQFQKIDLDYFVPYLNKELKHLEIADGIKIKKLKEGIGSVVYLLKEKETINLADLGFGTIQLLPILMKVCIIAAKNSVGGVGEYNEITKHWRFNPSTLIIEEPESNLHPKLQSALAEFFIRANKEFNIQFIIETHSEYLIRKLQYLTAKKEIAPSDTVIYYLNSPKVVKETGAEQVVKIEIKKDGSLTNDFGPGFFDEALKWQLELMHLHNQN